MNINIWWALFFMGLGGAIVGLFNALAWRKYYEGRSDGQAHRRKE